jgi:hypothetical protein
MPHGSSRYHHQLAVADEMLVVALVVIVGASVGIVAVVLHHRPGDAQQCVGNGDCGLLDVEPAEQVGQAPEPGPRAG